jgi:hypothetical protein
MGLGRYIVFAWSSYEAGGGWDDLRLSTNQIETANEFFDREVISSEKTWSWDSGQIVDKDTGEILREVYALHASGK